MEIYHSRRELETFRRLGNLRRHLRQSFLRINTRWNQVLHRRTLNRSVQLQIRPLFGVNLSGVSRRRIGNEYRVSRGGNGSVWRGKEGIGGIFGVLRSWESVLSVALEEMLDAELGRLGLVALVRFLWRRRVWRRSWWWFGFLPWRHWRCCTHPGLSATFSVWERASFLHDSLSLSSWFPAQTYG